MLKKTLFTALILGSASAFTASALADATTAPICPGADAIKSQPLTNVDASKHSKGKLVASATSNYGTSQQWTFKIGGFKMKNQENLLSKANTVLQTVSGGGNAAVLHKNVWACKYTAQHGFKAWATTPAN